MKFTENILWEILLNKFFLNIVALFCFCASSSFASDVNLKEIIANVESEYGIPDGLLAAIAKVESKTKPYAVNARKKSHYFTTKDDAADFIETKLKKGYKNISIGCCQLLYAAHKRNFNNSPKNMLDPEKNIRYAAKFLKKLYTSHGSWEIAVKRYHSVIGLKADRYYKRVLTTRGTDRNLDN